MVHLTQDGASLLFHVKVVPRASRSEIAGEHGDALRVRIGAPPVGGAANSELLRTLAAAFNIPVRDVEIRAGHSSALKRVAIKGLSVEQFRAVAGVVLLCASSVVSVALW